MRQTELMHRLVLASPVFDELFLPSHELAGIMLKPLIAKVKQ
jgi:hypothetical protein